MKNLKLLLQTIACLLLLSIGSTQVYSQETNEFDSIPWIEEGTYDGVTFFYKEVECDSEKYLIYKFSKNFNTDVLFSFVISVEENSEIREINGNKYLKDVDISEIKYCYQINPEATVFKLQGVPFSVSIQIENN